MGERGVDVLVVGGGVIGLAIACEAARAGMSVRLLERGQPGGEASGASAGMLAAQLEAHAAGPLLSLSLASRDRYHEFLRALEEETGLGVDLRREGALVVALDEAEAETLRREAEAQRALGLPIEPLGGEALRRREAAVAPQALSGFLLPHEDTLDPIRLTHALRRGAEILRVDIRAGTEVTALHGERGAVRGVIAADGARHPAESVVIAAGAWSGSIAGAGITPPPSEPVRGQVVCFRAPGLIRSVVAGTEAYLVPRGDGRLLVGSTMERAGFDRSVTAEGLARLSAAAIRLVPTLAGRTFDAAWAGLRPGAPDGLPVIGRAAPGLIYACGHLRNGIVLTPITALIIGRLLAGRDPGFELRPFRPDRFAPPPGR